MNKNLINGVLIVIAGIGLLTGFFMATPVPEPASMLFFGTGLIGVAGIVKKEND